MPNMSARYLHMESPLRLTAHGGFGEGEGLNRNRQPLYGDSLPTQHGYMIVPAGVTLTLEAGTTIIMSGTSIGFGIDGHFQSLGTASKPVTVTADKTTPHNHWMVFDEGSGYITGTLFQQGEMPIVVYSQFNLGGEFIMKNSVFISNEVPIAIAMNRLHQVQMNDISFQNNVFDRIYVSQSSIGPDFDELRDDVVLAYYSGLEAYEVTGGLTYESSFVVPDGITLTLEPSVTLMMNEFGEFRVDGRLQSKGTPTQPVTITSVLNSGPGQWAGLIFAGGQGHLEHTTVRYGENNITVLSPTASLHLAHSQIISGYDGLVLAGGETAITCSTITDQQNNGILIPSNTTPNVNIFSSNVFNNDGWGILNQGNSPVEARHNWWGAADGPGGLSPGGGDEISGTVTFTPWLSQPECLITPTVSFSTSNYTVTENAATAVLTVSLNFSPATTGTVHFNTVPDTAVPHDDYLPSSNTITFTPGLITAVLSITLLDDNQYEPDETFHLSLSSPQNLLLGSPLTAIITIVDDDSAQADLSLGLTAFTDSVLMGEPFTYTLTISNSGPQTATAVTLTNILLPEVTLLTTPTNCTGTHNLICTWPTLAVSSSLSLAYQVAIVSVVTGTITNSATITAVTLDPDLSNNTAYVTTAVVEDEQQFHVYLPFIRKP